MKQASAMSSSGPICSNRIVSKLRPNLFFSWKARRRPNRGRSISWPAPSNDWTSPDCSCHRRTILVKENMKGYRRDDGKQAGGQRVGLARALSKLGFCSRQQAWARIQAGDVQVNGVVIRHPEHGVDWRNARIEVNGVQLQAAASVYL